MKQPVPSTRQIFKGPNHILQSLYAQTRKLHDIADIVNLASNIEVAVSSFKNNNLTLSVASAAEATRIRYRQRNIIAALRRKGLEVQKLQVRVAPGFFPEPPAVVERHLSKDVARQIESTAEHIDDEPLKAALVKLAQNARRD